MRRVGGYIAVVIGSFMGIGVLLNAAGPHSAGALLLSFVLFSAAPLVGGVWLLREPGGRRAALAAASQAWDSELMRLAERRGGSLSVAEVVAHADLDVIEAEQRLDALFKRGLCELQVTERGVVVYRFPELPSVGDKRAARGVLE